ncbi:amidophosphoribosyltransferase [Thiosulfatimonas sediminis]|uniref:Amidophosphoribosyltransferase n=1 Tax=Thiosulfatimonas sediminis TaxID=2675054 RepID=A0A6F8PRZ7_9GAMM|nr:ComF family protein [Thiosulfatimonas sediminis]BBP44807.1 amidophosphoribosyltransferase [Thiosulfatimonas sediminis]
MHWLERWLIAPQSVLSNAPADDLDLTAEEIRALSRPYAICPRCAEASFDGNLCGTCLHQPPAFQQATVAFYFHEPITRLIYDLKYHRQASHARLLAELFLAEVGETLRQQQVQALVPVPIHPLRRRQRGYNQALLLAQALSRGLQIPVLDKGLRRVKNTVAQTHLDAKQRHNNLQGAFAIVDGAFDGLQRIALVDDVMTTGATMQQIAVLLAEHSTLEFIAAWAIAKTE